MSTEAIVCPTCRAADTSRADPNGVHTCVYCGARYRLAGQVPAPLLPSSALAGPPTYRRARLTAAFALVSLLLAAGVGGYLSTRRTSRAAPPRPPVRVSVQSVEPARNPIAVVAPEPPATASFNFHAKASGYKTSFYVLGWVTNTSPFAIGKPKIVAVMLDAAGKEVGTAMGYASVNALEPGERTPIKVLLSNPPPHADLRYEVVVRKATYRPPGVTGLRLEPGKPAPSSLGGGWDVSGKVFHDGQEPARFVRVTILALDEAGKLIGLHDAYAEGTTEVFAPGQSARFSALHAFPQTSPARFEFQVEATVAKH